MKNKILLSSLLFISSLALLSGHVFAAYAVNDNASSFSIQIKLDSPTRTVTFYTPNSGDSSCQAYTSTPVEANYGETLNDIDVPATSPFLNFTFGGWYLDNAFTQSFSSSTPIENSISLYAKYTRSNVLYDGTSSFFVSSSSDQTVDSQYLYKVSSQTWGITPTTSEANKVDLISESGIYKMTYASSTWSILRKVGFKANDTSWWGNDGCVTYAYGQPEDRNSWTDKYWAGTLSIGSAYVSSTQSGTVYIDYSIPYLGAVRYYANAEADLSDGDKRPLNNTNHIHLTNGYKYSKDRIYLYIYSNGTQVGWGE